MRFHTVINICHLFELTASSGLILCAHTNTQRKYIIYGLVKPDRICIERRRVYLSTTDRIIFHKHKILLHFNSNLNRHVCWLSLRHGMVFYYRNDLDMRNITNVLLHVCSCSHWELIYIHLWTKSQVQLNALFRS